MSHEFGQGDIVRVLEGPHAGREGAIYDAIGIPHGFQPAKPGQTRPTN